MPHRRATRDALDRYAARSSPSAASRCWLSTPSSASRAGCHSTRRASARSSAAFGVQHGGVIHHQHELAGLCRRIDDELSHADGRARVPQLRLGGGRHRAGDRVHPRHRAREQDTIGNFWVDTTRGLLWILLPVCVVVALLFVSQGVVQNLKATTSSRCSRARRADDRAGPGGLAGGHQAVRHQRRRLLQRQQRAPVREPDAALELPGDVPRSSSSRPA